MSLCKLCNAIDIRQFGPACAKSQMPHYIDNIHHHHASAYDLKISALSCSLCHLFVDGMEAKGWRHDEVWDATSTNYPRIWYFGLVELPPDRKARENMQDRESTMLVGIHFTCQSMDIRVDLYAEEDSVAAKNWDVIGRCVRPAQDFRLATRWYLDCLRYHNRCSHKGIAAENTASHVQWSPTRVIDTGPMGESVQPRLVCDAMDLGPYLTLSHCWGSSPVLRTIKKTLDAHMDGIPFELLPKTFRDAIIITRNLGFRYLWIDSLCIVQDDYEDWERESAMMAQIYMNSALNVAASSSPNSEVGSLISRRSDHQISLKYRSRDSSAAGQVYVRKPLKTFDETVNSGPLNRRAWVLQERLLSRRIIHYTEDQLHWECQEICLSEDGNTVLHPDRVKSNSILSRIASSPPQHLDEKGLYSNWYEMLDVFTRAGLTKGSDKLPALSGLANVFARQTGDRYVAGLWESDLKAGLLWRARRSDLPRLRPSPTYRAPSWSWAALDGHILFPFSDWDRDAASINHNIQVVVEESGSDPYGAVASGFLCLTGRLKEVDYKIVSASMEHYDSIAPSMTDPLYSAGEHIGDAHFDQLCVEGESLFCLDLSPSFPNDETGSLVNEVLLLKAAGQENTFLRTGTASLDNAFTRSELSRGHRWFDDGMLKSIRIT